MGDIRAFCRLAFRAHRLLRRELYMTCSLCLLLSLFLSSLCFRADLRYRRRALPLVSFFQRYWQRRTKWTRRYYVASFLRCLAWTLWISSSTLFWLFSGRRNDTDSTDYKENKHEKPTSLCANYVFRGRCFIYGCNGNSFRKGGFGQRHLWGIPCVFGL